MNRETATIVNGTSFLESGTVSPDGTPATPVKATFVVKHDAGTTIDGVKSDLDWNTTDNIAAAPVENGGLQVVATRPDGGFNYSTVQYSGSPGTYDFGDGLFCLFAGSTANQTARFRVVTSAGETATVAATVHLSRASTSCSSAPRAYVVSTSQSDTTVTTPGQTTNFTFSPTDPRSNTITGYKWRWRRLNDNVTGTASADITTINSDGTGGTFASDTATLNLLNVTVPQRGRYVIEAQLRSSTATYADTSAWYRLGTVDADFQPPTASISAPASVVRGTPYTATVTTADADTTGRPQMIEWDIDGNATNGPLGDGFEERQYGTTEATPGLTLSHVVQTTGAPTGLNPIRVRVTDNGAMNGSDAVRRQVVATASPDVTNPAPTAAFVCNPCTGKTPLTVQFSAAESHDDGSIASYAWDFGDGNTGSGQVVQHTYTSEGTYTPSLVVTDNEGATASATGAPVTAGTPNVAPVSNPVITGAPSGDAPFTTTFSGDTSTDADGTIVSYQWAWGDGTISSYGSNQTHQFVIPGTYTVTLTVKDSDGATHQSTVSVTADNVKPNVDFFITPDSGLAQTTAFVFDASASSDPNVGDFIQTYEWDFDGDGVWDSDTAGPVTTHAYGIDGIYYPIARVKDQRGAWSDTTIRGITVGAPDNLPPVAAFTVSTLTPQKPNAAVTVDASTSIDPDFFGGIESYEWEWGDGTPNTGPSSDPVATHVYTGPSGPYTIRLRLVDNRGAESETTQAITVLQAAPNTAPIKGVAGVAHIPGSVSGDAVASWNVRSLNFFGTYFYIGNVNYVDGAAGKDARGLVLFKPAITRYGLNGAEATGVITFSSTFKSGSLNFKVDDLSAYNEGPDHIEISGTGGAPALNFSNTGSVTSGDVLVY